MTAEEFLYPLRGAPRKVLVTAALYFTKHFGEPPTPTMTPTQIKTFLVRGGISKARRMNPGQGLTEAVPLVHRAGGRGIWGITASGEKEIEELLQLSPSSGSPVHDVTALKRLITSQEEVAVRGYLEEAAKCLEVDALRAAVVFLWAGAIRVLQENAIAVSKKRLNEALQKHDPKSRQVKKLDDFAYIKDKWLLLAAQELEIIDKGERGTLEEALSLRNRCGHPTNYRPRSAKVGAFIEDIAGIVF